MKRVKLIIFNDIDRANSWLEQNSDLEIEDIKFSSTESCFDVLIIYREERSETDA